MADPDPEALPGTHTGQLLAAGHAGPLPRGREPMPGVSIVSADYYRRHLADLRTAFAEYMGCEPIRRREVAKRVRFAARCLMRSDCPDVDPREFLEAQRLIDLSAGALARYGDTEPDERRKQLAEAYEAIQVAHYPERPR